MAFTFSDDYIDQLGDFLEDLVTTFGFETAGVAGKSLADDAVEAVAESISEDARNGKAPDGSDWAKNHGPYKDWKSRKYGIYDPGYKTKETLSIKALKGEVTITNEKVTMTHGTGAVDADGASDKEKGVWLTDGCDTDSKGRKQDRAPRPFYALNDERNDTVTKVMGEGLGKHMADKAGGI